MSRQTGQSRHLREAPVLVGALKEWQRSMDYGEVIDDASRRVTVHDKAAIPRALPAAPIGERYRVTDAETGTAALDRIRAGTPDLTLPDREAGAADGPALVQRTRDRGSALPIIVVSDGDDAGDRIAALNAGADDDLTRPTDLGELPAGAYAVWRDRLQQRDRRPVSHRGDPTLQYVHVHIRPLRGKFELEAGNPPYVTTRISVDDHMGARR